MAPPSEPAGSRRWVRPLAAASGLVAIFVSVLAFPLAAADSLGLSERETVGWIMAIYASAGIATLVLAWRYRQPLMVTGNIFLLIFVVSLGSDTAWPDLVGAAMIAGLLVLVAGLLGLVGWVARWLPPPIVYGVLAGAVLPFFVDLFTAAGDEPWMVGTTIVVYLLARRYLEPSVPALLPAIVFGLAIAALAGELGSIRGDVALMPVVTRPELDLPTIVTVVPVMFLLVTIQANAPSVVFLRDQGYEPPETTLDVVSGAGSTASSLFGPVGLSLSLPATALCAGPSAGDRRVRHWAGYIAGAASFAIGIAAGFATTIAEAIPTSLLAAFVGLAVLSVLATALREVSSGPLTLGPLFAFGISLSDLEIADLGPFFWALVGGLVVSLVLERDAWIETTSPT